MLLQDKSIFYYLFRLILTMRRQTAISACEIHFSVVIWIQSVTDANDILAPNLPLSLFNSVPSTWRPLLHCFVGVAMTTQSLCTHISARKRQRGAPWHYLYRHHQGHFLSAVCLPKADPHVRELLSRHDVHGHYLIWIHDILWLSLSALS